LYTGYAEPARGGPSYSGASVPSRARAGRGGRASGRRRGCHPLRCPPRGRPPLRRGAGASVSRPLSPDAPEAVRERHTRAQAAHACEQQDARPLADDRLRRDLADRFVDHPSQLRIALDCLTRIEQSPVRAAEIRFGDRLAEWNRQTAEALHARARRQSERQQRTAKALAALVAGDRRLCHRLALGADRSTVTSSTCPATVDRSPPSPGALVRSSPIAAHAPPTPACSRRSSGPVWTVGRTSLTDRFGGS